MSRIEIDWEFEQRAVRAGGLPIARAGGPRGLRKWHRRKRDDAVAEMVGKMWDQWARLLDEGQGPRADALAADPLGEACGSATTGGSPGGPGTPTSTTTGRR